MRFLNRQRVNLKLGGVLMREYSFMKLVITPLSVP